MTDFDTMIKNLALHVRAELAKVDEIHMVEFSITVTGRVLSGDLKITYNLGSSYSDGGCVSGGQIDYILEEYLRRNGWDKRHKPLVLTFSGEPATTQDDEIPF